MQGENLVFEMGGGLACFWLGRKRYTLKISKEDRYLLGTYLPWMGNQLIIISDIFLAVWLAR